MCRLWGDLQDWRMRRLTFGVTSSPFLATHVPHQLAEDLCCKYPQAADTLVSNFYVDDCLTGAPDVQGAKCLQQELCSLLSEAGLSLRKWHSNSEKLLASIPVDLRESKPLTIAPEPSACGKALGVHWDMTTDSLYISIPTVDLQHPTKRYVA